MSNLLRAHHFGIVGMHEWAKLVQGNLSINQHDDGGTAVTLEIPRQR
ncbi:MAG: hypothetical protein GY943_39600 [Chloroflexi bacterium]|nr:hypothetical protein [Chloroflexota bacterium]